MKRRTLFTATGLAAAAAMMPWEAAAMELPVIDRAELRRRCLEKLSAQLAQSSNPLCVALHDDPRFVAAIYAVQEQQWDPVTRTTVSPEHAVKIAVRGTGKSMDGDLRELYRKLHRAFGEDRAAVDLNSPAAQEFARRIDGKKSERERDEESSAK